MSELAAADDFFAVLRTYLPYLDASTRLQDDAKLADYGLDSLGTISLMLDLETALDILFPEDALTPETFETVGSLRGLVASLQDHSV